MRGFTVCVVLAFGLASAARFRTEPSQAAPEASKMKISAKVAKKFERLDSLRKKTNWTLHTPAPQAPAHIKLAVRKHFDEVGVIPFVRTGGCGARKSASKIGAKPKQLASLLAKSTEHPGRESFAVPGSGGTQTVKDDGLSEQGTVDGEEPYVTVLKDGYFEVGCFYDSMNVFSDKFGNEKDKYKDQADVSIVRYKEIILKEKQESMTPTLCFEFCRSLPDMVFFGITNGDECYCTPYYKPAALDSSNCDTPCQGDASVMCGNKKKSTIWEMHLCADTEQDLSDAMAGAKEAIDFYYEQAVLGDDLADKMTAAGKKLEKDGGLFGAPTAADNGKEAMKATKPLGQGFMAGYDDYAALLKAYKAGDSVKGGDFTDASKTTKAERATADMKKLTGPVLGAAQSVNSAIRLAYPAVSELLGDEPDPSDGVGVALAKEDSSFDYRSASYSFDEKFAAGLSSCKGPLIGSPVYGVSVHDCGTICSATVYPKKCVGFSYYSVDGGDLCFLLEDIHELMTFECPDAPKDCWQTKDHEHPDAEGVPASCGPSAVCMVKMSEVSTGYKPKQGRAEWTKAARCYGEPSTRDFSAYEMPSIGSSATILGKDLETAL